MTIMHTATSLAHRGRAIGRLVAPGRKMPTYLLLFVTNRCSARCEHCFYWKDLNTRIHEEMTLEEYDKLARSMGSVLQITFTGGSPELRKDLPELVNIFYRHSRPANMTFCMLGQNTNRILSHVEKILQQCPGQNVKIGISFDGLHEEHDRLRGIPGLFDNVVRTIHELGALRRHYPRLRVDVGLTVHGLNYTTVEDTAAWARKNLPIDVMKPILVRGDPLNPETRNDICKTTYRRVVDNDHDWVSGTNHAELSALDYLVHAKEWVQRDMIFDTADRNEAPLACAGGRETAVIYPTGEVGGCELRDDVLGNLREVDMDFGRVWFGKEADHFRDSAGAKPVCQGCYHHCFIAPALFRSPSVWPKLAAAAWKVYRNQGAPA